MSRFLFLDRDGVINERLVGDYVKSPDEFVLCQGVVEAMKILRSYYDVIVVVTNQQGIGKELMTEEDLSKVHDYMLAEIDVHLDAIYHCPELAGTNPLCRKPLPGMAWKAQKKFPSIDFSRSVMVGDSVSDMEFGLRLGMHAAFISEESYDGDVSRHDSLLEFAHQYTHHKT